MALPEYITKLQQKIQLTKDVFELRFDMPHGFKYVAGQFIQFPFIHDDKAVSRSYSLSSAPHELYLECCIKYIPGRLGSEYLKSLKVGDAVRFKGPAGVFANTTNDNQPLFFIATGVGLAPIMGIITDELICKRNSQPICLLFGVRHETDIFWLERLETLARDYPNFTYILTLSQPGAAWDSHCGRVTSHLDGVSPDQRFFVCGSLPMVKDVRAILVDKKVNPKSVHFEIF